MATGASPSSFRLNSVDRHGRRIDPAVLAATISQLIARRDPPGEPAPIRNLPGYVFRAFVRQVNRLKSKELAVLDAAIAGQTLAQRLADPSRQLEMKVLVDECLAQFDFTERDMCWRRLEGFTWDEIGPIHALSGHAAEVRFRNAVRAVKAKLARSRKPLPRTAQTDKNEQLMPSMEADDDKRKT